MTISGAVLCPQSMNPTYAFASLHLMQVEVCGSASRRAGAIWHPHLAQGSVTIEIRDVGGDAYYGVNMVELFREAELYVTA